MLHFTIKYNINSLSIQISLILGNRKFNVNVEPSTCGGSIISLSIINGFPFTMMRLQHFHDLIIIWDRTKPTVKAREKQHINLIMPHGIQHPLELRPFMQLFSGCLCSIYVDTDNDPSLLFCISLQAFSLGFQGKSFDFLLLSGDTDIKCNPDEPVLNFFA